MGRPKDSYAPGYIPIYVFLLPLAAAMGGLDIFGIHPVLSIPTSLGDQFYPFPVLGWSSSTFYPGGWSRSTLYPSWAAGPQDHPYRDHPVVWVGLVIPITTYICRRRSRDRSHREDLLLFGIGLIWFYSYAWGSYDSGDLVDKRAYRPGPGQLVHRWC
jgi:hypothetical protein